MLSSSCSFLAVGDDEEVEEDGLISGLLFDVGMDEEDFEELLLWDEEDEGEGKKSLRSNSG